MINPIQGILLGLAIFSLMTIIDCILSKRKYDKQVSYLGQLPNNTEHQIKVAMFKSIVVFGLSLVILIITLFIWPITLIHNLLIRNTMIHGLKVLWPERVEYFTHIRRKTLNLKPMAVIHKNSMMSFGKHEGKRMHEIPDSYLQWIYENKKATSDVLYYIQERLDLWKRIF